MDKGFEALRAEISEVNGKVTEHSVHLKYMREKIDEQGAILHRNASDIATHIRRTDLLQANQDGVLQTLASMTEAMKEIEDKIQPMARHLMFHSWVAKGLYLLFGGSFVVTILNISQIVAALAPLFGK